MWLKLPLGVKNVFLTLAQRSRSVDELHVRVSSKEAWLWKPIMLFSCRNTSLIQYSTALGYCREIAAKFHSV